MGSIEHSQLGVQTHNASSQAPATPSQRFGMSSRRTSLSRWRRRSPDGDAGCAPAGMEGIALQMWGCCKTPGHQRRCLRQPLRLGAGGEGVGRDLSQQGTGMAKQGEPGGRQPLASPCPPSAFIILPADPERWRVLSLLSPWLFLTSSGVALGTTYATLETPSNLLQLRYSPASCRDGTCGPDPDG